MVTVNDSPTCSVCAGPLTSGRCLNCERQSVYRFVHREIVMLAILAGITVVAFLLTRGFATSNEELRRRDARTFYIQGQEALGLGHLNPAVTALQQAVTKDPDELTYRRALVRALIAAKQDEKARQLLLEMRDRQSEDPETNLELARLERSRDETAASRYYETAILGLWRPEQRDTQQQVRIEFVEFLLNRQERDRALSELLVLETSLPDDGPAQLAAGRMFLAAGSPRRALDHFERMLHQSPDDPAALAGAGEAAFDLSDYSRARRYFNAIKQDDSRTKDLRLLTNLVLSTDPLAPRLSIGERKRRLSIIVEQAIQRVETCRARPAPDRPNAGPDLEPSLDALRMLDSALLMPNGPGTSDEIESGLDLVARTERQADQACRPPDPADRAVLLIARRHNLEEP